MWRVPGGAAGKELCPPETGSAAERCCAAPRSPAGGTRAPSQQGSGGGDASSFPSQARTGDMTFWVSQAGFLLPSAATRRLVLPLRKEEISRSGSSGSDEEV